VVPEGEAGRKVGDDKNYNEVAAAVMRKHGIVVNDLYRLTAGFSADRFIRPGDVHFTKQGYRKLAAQVSESVLAALANKVPAPLQVRGAWKPSHPQNERNIVTAVEVFAPVAKPYEDPRTGKMVFQSKGIILKLDADTGEYVAAGPWAYLRSAAPLKKRAVLVVEGRLSVSEGQIKGGEHPATIRVTGSRPATTP
jgi:hypothetical protein